jgi:hypothetical protein
LAPLRVFENAKSSLTNFELRSGAASLTVFQRRYAFQSAIGAFATRLSSVLKNFGF